MGRIRWSGPVEELPVRWRAKGAMLREWPGNDGAAIALERAADELEQTLESWLDEVLTLDRASLESGYSVGHLGRRLRENPELNVGRKHSPRIRRRELPQKLGGRSATAASDTNDSDQLDRLFQDIASLKFGGEDA